MAYRRTVSGGLACALLCASAATAAEDPTAAPSLPPGETSHPRRVMPVTMQQCVLMAERNSLSLRADEVSVQLGKASIGQAMGAFDTALFADINYNKDISPNASALETGSLGGPVTPEVQVIGILAKSWNVSAGFRGTLTSGLQYQADVNWSKSFRSQGTFGNFNPAYRSSLGVSVTQPLLQGFGTTVNKAPVLKAENSLRGAAEAFESSRVRRAEETVGAYWDYYFSHRTLETREFLVKQAEQLVRINKRKEEVGDMTPLQVVEVESDLAQRRQQLLVAENEVGRTEDALKRLIFSFEDPAEWEIDLVAVTDATVVTVSPPKWTDAARVALEHRPELREQRELLKNNDIDIVVAENGILPRLDLSASARTSNLAASKGEVLNYTDDYYAFGAGLSFEMPLLNRIARYGLSIARLAKIQALLRLKDLENQIIQEVRNAVREVTNTRKQIEAAEEAVRLADQRWSNERRRQEVGYSTTFEVRDAEASWLEAKDAEIEALFRYQLAIAALERAQGSLLQTFGILSAPTPVLDDRAGLHYGQASTGS